MGESLSCCNQPLEGGLAREIITTDGSEGFKQQLEEFLAKFPSIKEVYGRKWNYCHNIDKDVITVTSEATYVGKLSEDPREMVVLYAEGFLYEGDIQAQKRNGLGRLISMNGDCYEGKWADNEPEGEGTYEGKEPRRKYTGTWSKGALVGRGKATYEDGSFYEGEFYQNMRHGKGKIKYADGTNYEGDFKNNVIEGFGTLIGINHKYEGSWRAGKMHGGGKSYWYSEQEELQETYEGEYVEGLKHGKGEYRWANGRVFKGEWENGEIKKPSEIRKSSH